jgi:hypothetical protein
MTTLRVKYQEREAGEQHLECMMRSVGRWAAGGEKKGRQNWRVRLHMGLELKFKQFYYALLPLGTCVFLLMEFIIAESNGVFFQCTQYR